MPVVSIPTFPGNETKAKAQAEYIKTLISSGWVVTGSVYDKDKKVVIETIVLTPDTSMSGYAPAVKTKGSTAAEPPCTLITGEPIKIISNPDPSWTAVEGIATIESLIGKTGKFIGVYAGDTKYKGYAVIRLDEFFPGCHDCQGMVTDGHGFFCKVASLQTLAKPEQKTSDVEVKVGSIVRIISNPYSSYYGKNGTNFVGKEGEVEKLDAGEDKNLAVVKVINIYGDTDQIFAEKGTYTSSSVFIPDYAVTLSTGDIVKVIAANGDGTNKQFVDKMGYVCGPLVSAKPTTKTPLEKIKVQIGIVPSVANAPYGTVGMKYSEQRVSMNVNCIEVIPPKKIFAGIKKGDTVTIVENPDYPKLEAGGQKWIGREATFLGFPEPTVCELCGETGTHTPECKVKTGLHYRYKYAAELEVGEGKKLYALVGSITKGTASSLGIFKIGDWVILNEENVAELGISQATYNKRYKGVSGQVTDIYYSLGSPQHGWYIINFPAGSVSAPRSHLTEGKKNA